MFTGIVEHSGIIHSLKTHAAGGRITTEAPTLQEHLSVSNSIAVSGCCLTITAVKEDKFSADLSAETLRKTTFSELCAGAEVNLEQPLTAGEEFGGHFVLGHVDTIGRVTHLTPEGENWWFGVQVPAEFARYIVPKGSITVDGISLTVARWQNSIVEAAVIPYTYEHTCIRDRKPGDAVNLEGDVLGKYVGRHLEARSFSASQPSQLTVARLVEEGF